MSSEVLNTASFDRAELMTNTAEIVAAFLQRPNSAPITHDQLPSLISSVMGALNGAPGAVPTAESSVDSEVTKATPAQVKKSITPDALISFIDGKPYKSLKRHAASHGLSPEQYRVKFGLPADYPMTCSNYSDARRALAKSMGLGRVPGKAAAPAETAAKGGSKKKSPTA